MTTDNPLLFSTIADSEDPDKLRRIMSNARDRGAQDVVDAALHRLVTILPTAQKGTIPYDVWRTIHAFEEVLTQERQRTTRLSRTRQAIQRKGEIETIKDLVRKPKPSEGFAMLMERGMLELSFEALVIHRADCFEPEVVSQARARLEDAGADLDSVLAYWRSS